MTNWTEIFDQLYDYLTGGPQKAAAEARRRHWEEIVNDFHDNTIKPLKATIDSMPDEELPLVTPLGNWMVECNREGIQALDPKSPRGQVLISFYQIQAEIKVLGMWDEYKTIYFHARREAIRQVTA